eukprot:TRINITY_DN54_c0_g2_i1.p1 TRINITY_DN54_c0_g2~~TRINITY_DN54_c0_g2_i1.p1  ORF type:complete len:341 (+),score=24.09 TRINITY_DN54_c0_g2_i1:57-1079(+)
MADELADYHTFVDKLPRRLCSPLGLLPCMKKRAVERLVKMRTQPVRAKFPETPATYGIFFSSVSIISTDGVRLSAWEIFKPGTTKLAVINHPLSCNRYGSVDGFDGVSVNFLPLIKTLHEAGFSVLTYDQRGQGESDGNFNEKRRGPVDVPVGVGSTEWQDFAGVMNFVNNHSIFKTCQVAIISHCMGANAVFAAWQKVPECFTDRVKCQVAVQPVISFNMMARMTSIKLGMDLASEIDDAIFDSYGFRGANPIPFMPAVKVPVLFTQVRDDVYTRSIDAQGFAVSDLQHIVNACPTEKETIWIGPNEDPPHGKGLRFEGYSFFNKHPQKLLEFLSKHIS